MRIGNKRLTLSNFDTIKIIVTRYVLEKAKEDSYVTARYVKVDLLDPISQSKIKPVLLTEILKDIEFENIEQSYKAEFPNISLREATLLWANINGVDDEKLSKLDPIVFPQRAGIKIDLMDMRQHIETANEKLAVRLAEFDTMVSRFEKLKSIPTSPLTIESIITRFTLEDRFIAQELFDNIVVNEQNPICKLGADEDSLFRVYTGLNLVEFFPLKDEFTPSMGEVIFSVLGYRTKAHSSKHIDVTHSEDADIEAISAAISDLNVIVSERRQIAINATFTLETKDFNRAIFSDLITTDKLMGYFLYLSEFRMPELLKNRFTVLFEPRDFRTTVRTMSPSFTILPTKNRNESIVRVMNAISMYEGDLLSRVVGKTLAYYENKKEAIRDIYTTIVPKTFLNSFNFKYPVGGKGELKKEGRRLVQLKTKYPYTFRKGYAQMCQPQRRQPFILEEKDVDAYVKKYGASKILKYEDGGTGDMVTYACEPREPGEDGDYNFIGLGTNKSKNVEYRDEVPYIPCCYLQNQYTKKSSVINTKISTIIEADYTQEGREPTMGYPLDPIKSVPRGRFGELPEYIQELANVAGYDGDKTPFYRYGVMSSPASLLHCMLRAFDETYIFNEKEIREKAVRDLRIELAKHLLTPIAQQTTGMSSSEIKSMLRDDEAYVDPDITLNLIAKYFECNIYLFEVDKTIPRGEIVILRSDGAMLPIPVNENLKSVVIVKNRVEGLSYPYQCSVIVKKTRGSMKFTTTFKDEALTTEIAKVVSSHLEIRALTGINFKTITPITLGALGTPKSQYIDARGKTRALFYKRNVCLVTPPIAPFDIPRRSKIVPCPLEDAKKLASRLNLKLISQEVAKDRAVGLWFQEGGRRLNSLYYAYIPIEPTPLLDKISIASPMLHDPLRVTSTSKLQEYRDGRKIASLLVRWAMELYREDPDEFGENSFRIDSSLSRFEDYYSKYLERGSAVYVPSSEVMGRVRMRVRVAILNGTINDTLDFRRYGDAEDFSYQKGTTVVRGVRGLEILMLQSELYNQRWFITSAPNVHTTLPYILHHPSISRAPVIIQNVKDGVAGAAISVASWWKINKKNTGYDTEPIPIKNFKYNVLTLEDPRPPQSTDVKILKYDDGTYAAILEMTR